MNNDIIWHKTSVAKSDRQRIKGHKSMAVWFTGLSGSGKSTIANAVEKELNGRGIHTYLLDGDNIRHGLNKDLGFSPEDRGENIRRIAEVAKLFVDAGIIVLCAFISPYRKDRDSARSLFLPGEFVEAYIKCPLEECIRRDPKGLYKKAKKNEIPQFTGITDDYEEPVNPEILINTKTSDIKDSIQKILNYIC